METTELKTLKLHKHIVSCRLFDLMALNPNDFHEYKEPIYTKLGCTYGYLSVSMFNVHFFWYDGSNICFDDVSDKFRVEYVSLNGN